MWAGISPEKARERRWWTLLISEAGICVERRWWLSREAILKDLVDVSVFPYGSARFGGPVQGAVRETNSRTNLATAVRE